MTYDPDVAYEIFYKHSKTEFVVSVGCATGRLYDLNIYEEYRENIEVKF
jgi:hypothetical protein